MSNTSPTTWFSGKSAPEDQKGPSALLIFAAAFTLYSPLGAVALVACFVAFNYYRVSHKVIAGAAAMYCIPYFTGVAFFSSTAAMFDNYHAPIGRFIAAAKDKDLDGFFSENWWFWFTSQLWLSLALGLIVGTAFTTWKWIRRPVWEDNERIPGPIHRMRRRKVTREIAADKYGPADGATLGVDKYGNRIVQTEAEASAHTLLAGGSGAGKSTTMMIGIRDQIRRGEPVCVVDLKGAADLPAQLAEWSARYGRRFLHWSITDRRAGYTGPADGPAFYDPIGRGDPSRKKDLLIGSEKWDVEYYKSVNENYLQIAFQIAELVPNTQTDAFTDLAALLDLDKLKQRAAALFVHAPKTPEAQQQAAAHGLSVRWWEMTQHVLDPYVADVLAAAADTIVKPEESERSAIRNMAARVQKLRQSTAGAWLKRDPEHGRDIDLRRVADEGWVVVFSLDSSNYEATSAQVGGLIIQDLKTMSAELRAKPAPHPFHVYVDEFSAIGSDNIIGMLARARDARMPCMLSTQALADLKKADESFLDQALGIVNSFIIHRANTEADAEIFAGLTGKKMVYVKRYGVEMTSGLPGGIGTGSGTGQGHIEQQEDYVVPASGFQALKRGELVYITKSPKDRVVYPVTVVREDEMAVAKAVAEGVAALAAPAQRPELTSGSPFEAEAEAEEAFPSPWPVMAEDVHVVPGQVVTDEEQEYVPAPLHQVTGDLEESPRPSKASQSLSEFDSADDTPTVQTADRAESPRREIIDPALFRGDVPSRPAPDPEPVEQDLPPVPLPPTIALPGTATAPVAAPILDAAPAQAAATVSAAQIPPMPPMVSTAPPAPRPAPSLQPDEESSVFGGGEVDYEAVAPSWEQAEGLPVRPPLPLGPAQATRRDSGNHANVPTTTERPKHMILDESEWNE